MDIPKHVRILDIQNGYFGYQKQQFRISENKHLFQISKIVISDIGNKYLYSDIQNNYSGYQKLCPKGVVFEISKKSYFGYPE